MATCPPANGTPPSPPSRLLRVSGICRPGVCQSHSTTARVRNPTSNLTYCVARKAVQLDVAFCPRLEIQSPWLDAPAQTGLWQATCGSRAVVCPPLVGATVLRRSSTVALLALNLNRPSKPVLHCPAIYLPTRPESTVATLPDSSHTSRKRECARERWGRRKNRSQ